MLPFSIHNNSCESLQKADKEYYEKIEKTFSTVKNAPPPPSKRSESIANCVFPSIDILPLCLCFVFAHQEVF